MAWSDHPAQLSFVKSPVLPGRAVLPGMVARRWPLSTSARVALPGHHPADPAHATAKSAQIGLTRSWARGQPRRYHRNAVAPGFVPVERHADVPTKSEMLIPLGARRADGNSGDIAHAVSFRLRDAGFIWASASPVDGGRRLGS